jgi:hypothetical protein
VRTGCLSLNMADKQLFMSLADFEMFNLWPFSTGR